ncbi:MAG TPA: translation initiation factor IF-2 [Terriglobia bacterium]|nr:translation initiation factor IF-2 [Terriglobia bacterium]
MGKIRINDLARELEVKSKTIVEFLPEIGITEKRSHSSALDDDQADRVRAHFRAESEPAKTPAAVAEKAPPAAPKAAAVAIKSPAVAPSVARPSDHADVAKVPEIRPMTRSIAEIKAEARRAVMGPPPSRAVAPAVPPAKPVATGPAAPPVSPAARRSVLSPTSHVGRTATPAHVPPPTRSKISEVPTLKASGLASLAPAAKAHETPPAKSAHGARLHKSPGSNQPIYPSVIGPKGVPARPPIHRRAGEPRAMHPTASRPAAMPGIAASGGVPAVRPPSGRPGIPPPRWTAPTQRIVPPKPVVPEEVPITRKIVITEGISIKELSEKLEARAKDVIKRLLDKGIFATINQTLDSQTASEISRGFGAETSVITFEEEVVHEVEEADRPEDLAPRAPVVTVMGHVDHGKTSVLDAIRETNVTAHEAGGITQHIGAYHVEAQGRKIVFLDTPGHEAFTLMRARGSKVTDIVVLVVAADDGVMPQTLEAIDHARAAKVPIVVAINKIDKPEAQPERVKKQLADQNLMAEEWGGETVTVEVSAKQKKNLDLLLEMILLVADIAALKANPKRLATGTVLEGKLDRGRGPVATILVQNGTLHVGDSFIVGPIYGKVRAMLDDRGRPTLAAAPSTPVEVLGLEDVPQAGDRLQVIADTLKARQISIHRLAKLRETAMSKTARLTLEHLHEQMAAGDVKELPLIIKADVQGSVEVLADSLNKLSNEKVKVKVIRAGVGAITESDVLLASASNAVIIGFSVRPERKASELAALEKVDIRLHTIIYNVTDEIKKAMKGLLAIVYKETQLGHAEVRDTFRIPKVGTVAGCHVVDGKVTREARVRLLRDNAVVHDGKVRSLRRFKEDVTEVRSPAECGLAIENFNDVKIGDVVESYITEKVVESATA